MKTAIITGSEGQKDDPQVLLRTASNCAERDGDIQVLIDMLESANFGF